MPLVHNTVYTIRNDLTHTVLDFADVAAGVPDVSARGWGWHCRNNQQWKLIRVGEANLNTWKLQNQQLYGGQRRLLSRQAGYNDRCLVGVIDDANATFVIQRINGPSETYRILHDLTAVTLTSGVGVPQIDEANHVLDLQADGPPIALQTVEASNQVPKYRAQLWSFLPVAQSPLADGDYLIVNHKTGLVLDLTAANEVHGLARGQNEQKWTVTKDQNGEFYTFKNARVVNHLLTAPNASPLNNSLLDVQVGSEFVRFTIRKDPGTQLYKIFFVSQGTPSGLAVNLVAAAPNEPIAPRAVNLRIPTALAPTEKWSFV